MHGRVWGYIERCIEYLGKVGYFESVHFQRLLERIIKFDRGYVLRVVQPPSLDITVARNVFVRCWTVTGEALTGRQGVRAAAEGFSTKLPHAIRSHDAMITGWRVAAVG